MDCPRLSFMCTVLTLLYTGTYVAFVVLTMSTTMAYAMCHGAEVLHARLIARIVRAPMAFFDTTPIGRVTNRLSKDVDNADTTIPMNLRILTLIGSNIISTVLIMCLSGWQIVLGVLFLAASFVTIQVQSILVQGYRSLGNVTILCV